MKLKLFPFLLLFHSISAYSQTHFTKFKSPNYKTVNVQSGTSVEDSMQFAIVDLGNIHGLKGLEIQLREINVDSSKMLIYRNGKLIQTFYLPFMFWYVENNCLVADLDNNKHLDIRFTIEGGGSGLAGELAYKIYLFNQGSKFKLFAFFDFSHEKEYDLNKDGVYEIISCNYVYKVGHSYFAYNAYDFSNGKVINISKVLKYPLWTKYLYKSRNIIATNIPEKDRIKELRPMPDQAIIK